VYVAVAGCAAEWCRVLQWSAGKVIMNLCVADVEYVEVCFVVCSAVFVAGFEAGCDAV